MKQSKPVFYVILSVSELLLLAIAFVVILVQKRPVDSVLNNHLPYIYQLGIGTGLGIALGAGAALTALKIEFFKIMKELVRSLIGNFRLNILDFFIVSAAAAICEEMLFRVIIQGYLGIWLTSFIFILIHGYFNPKSLNMTVFGVIMFFLSAVIGYAYQFAGLPAAVSLHFFFDFTVFLVMAGDLKVLTSKV